MANQTSHQVRLFRQKSATHPQYSEFIKLLALYNNNYSPKLISHFHTDDLKIAIFSLRHHLRYVDQSIYDAITQDSSTLHSCIHKCLADHSESGQIIQRYLGVYDYACASFKDISKIMGISMSTVKRQCDKICTLIQHHINHTMFSWNILPELQPDVHQDHDRTTLYTRVENEPTYKELRSHMSKYSHQFHKSAISCIHNRGLRAAVASFSGQENKLTEAAYDTLLSNSNELEPLITSHVKSLFSHKAIQAYLCYWQLDEFKNVDMSPEKISTFTLQSVTLVRKNINKINNAVFMHLSEKLHLDNPYETAEEYASRPANPKCEHALIGNFIELFELNTTVEHLSKSDHSLRVIGEVFSHYKPEMAITARALMNNESANMARHYLRVAGLDSDCLSNAALRSRKYRFIKNLRRDFQVIRLNESEAKLYYNKSVKR